MSLQSPQLTSGPGSCTTLAHGPPVYSSSTLIRRRVSTHCVFPRADSVPGLRAVCRLQALPDQVQLAVAVTTSAAGADAFLLQSSQGPGSSHTQQRLPAGAIDVISNSFSTDGGLVQLAYADGWMEVWRSTLAAAAPRERRDLSSLQALHTVEQFLLESPPAAARLAGGKAWGQPSDTAPLARTSAEFLRRMRAVEAAAATAVPSLTLQQLADCAWCIRALREAVCEDALRTDQGSATTIGMPDVGMSKGPETSATSLADDLRQHQHEQAVVEEIQHTCARLASLVWGALPAAVPGMGPELSSQQLVTAAAAFALLPAGPHNTQQAQACYAVAHQALSALGPCAVSQQPGADATALCMLACVAAVVRCAAADAGESLCVHLAAHSQAALDTAGLPHLLCIMSALSIGCAVPLSSTWVDQWAVCTAAVVPHAPVSHVVSLMQLLTLLPIAVLHRLQHKPALWQALWRACSERINVTAEASPEQVLVCVSGVKAAARLRKAGLGPPDKWAGQVVSSVVSTLTPPSQPGDEAAAGMHMDTVLISTLQAAHGLLLPLSPDDAAVLAQWVSQRLRRMTQTHVSKVLPALPHLAEHLSPAQVSALRRSVAHSLVAVLCGPSGAAAPHVSSAPATLESTAALLRRSSGGRSDREQGASAAPPPPATQAQVATGVLGEPLSAWQLSNWLTALTQGPLSLVGLGHARNNTALAHAQADESHVLRVLRLHLQAAATPAVLAQASAPDLVNIAVGLASLGARPSAGWLTGLVSAASPRLLARLPPKQLALLYWACAGLDAGRVAHPGWVAHIRTSTHACMHLLDPPTRARAAYGAAQLLLQASAASAAAAARAEASADGEAGLSSDSAAGEHVRASGDAGLRPDPLWDAGTAAWVRHLLTSSQGSLRETDVGSLASLTCTLAQLLKPVVSRLSREDAQAVVDAANSGVTAGDVHMQWHVTLQVLPGWCDAVCDAYMRRAPTAPARAVANVMHGMTALQGMLLTVASGTPQAAAHSSTGRSSAWVLASVRRLQELGAVGHAGTKDVAGALMSLSSLHRVYSDLVYTPDLISRHVRCIAARAGALPASAAVAHDLSTAVRALVALAPHTPGLLQPHAPVRPGEAPSWSAVPVLAALHPALLRHVPLAGPGAATGLWTAAAQLRMGPDAELAGMLLLACHRHMQDMTASQLSQLAWSMTVLQLSPGVKWWDRLQRVVYRAAQEAEPRGLPGRVRATLLWALARGGWHAHREFVSVLVPSAGELRELSLGDLAMVSWAASRLGLRPKPQWCMILLMASARGLARMQLQQCQTTDAPEHSGEGAAGPGNHVLSDVEGTAADGAGLPAGVQGAARPLLMLAECLLAWDVMAPGWWWSAWCAALHGLAQGQELDGMTCSQALRALARRRRHLLQLAQHNDVMAKALRMAQDQLVACALRHATAAAARPTPAALPVLATLLECVARCVKLDRAHVATQQQLGILASPGALQLVAAAVTASLACLAAGSPGYVVLTVAAVSQLHSLGVVQLPVYERAGPAAQVDSNGLGVVVSARWREEALRVLELRSASLTVREQRVAAAAVQGLSADGGEDASQGHDSAGTVGGM